MGTEHCGASAQATRSWPFNSRHSRSNDDPVAHNIHPIAKVNRDWSRLEPPGTPSFSYSYEKEEIIPVKCNIHPWMQGYFVVLKTSHFATQKAKAAHSILYFPRNPKRPARLEPLGFGDCVCRNLAARMEFDLLAGAETERGMGELRIISLSFDF
jgi:hypothetical protein